MSPDVKLSPPQEIVLKAVVINFASWTVMGAFMAPTYLYKQLYILVFPLVPFVWSFCQIVRAENRSERTASWIAFLLSLIVPFIFALGEG